MRDIAIIAFAQMPNVRARRCTATRSRCSCPSCQDVRAKVGLTIDDIGFTCSGSTDYLAGQAFSFVSTLDGVGPWPPIQESHVEMDGAWALYEAWVKLQLGEIDTALVYCYGKSSPGDRSRGADPPARPVLASARCGRTRSASPPSRPGRCSTRARPPRPTWPRSPPAAARPPSTTPTPSWRGTGRPAELLAEAPIVAPLRKHDCPPITDGACRGRAGRRRRRPRACASARPGSAGIDHRIEPMALGLRDLTASASTRLAGEKAGVADGPVDVAELHAPFTHQELILREALGPGRRREREPVGWGAGRQPDDGRRPHPHRRGGRAHHRPARRPGAWPTPRRGPCLQQNLVCVLEGEG